MKHLNRVCKSAVANLGANKSSTGLKRTGKCVGALAKVLDNYDKEMKVLQHLGIHSTANATKDKHVILEELLKAKVFSCISTRKHMCFPNIARNILPPCNRTTLMKWMNDRLTEIRNKLVTGISEM